MTDEYMAIAQIVVAIIVCCTVVSFGVLWITLTIARCRTLNITLKALEETLNTKLMRICNIVFILIMAFFSISELFFILKRAEHKRAEHGASEPPTKPDGAHDRTDDKPEQAIAKILKLGGKVLRHESVPDKPFFFDVTLDRIKDTDACLAQVKSLAKIKKLQVSQSQVSKNGLQCLRGLTSLEELTFADVPLMDDELSNLRNLTSLKLLCISHCGISNAALEHIQNLTNIEQLYLFEPKVTDEGLIYLQRMTDLHRLVLAKTQVSDEGLKEIKDHRNLRELVLAETKVSDHGLELLKEMRELCVVVLTDTKVTEDGIKSLQQALPKLKIIH